MYSTDADFDPVESRVETSSVRLTPTEVKKS